MKTVTIKSSPINLGQFLKWAGVCGSGGAAKEIILSGLVTVNGEIARQRGKKLVAGDIVEIKDGESFLIAGGND